MIVLVIVMVPTASGVNIQKAVLSLLDYVYREMHLCTLYEMHKRAKAKNRKAEHSKVPGFFYDSSNSEDSSGRLLS